METKSRLPAGLHDACILLGGPPRSGTTLLASILRRAPDHFQAFELHMRNPSFVIGLNGNYTKRIFSELGLPTSEYERFIAGAELHEMNLGAWVGPKEQISAEPLTGKETHNFLEELYARAILVTNLMRRVAELHRAKTWGFKILADIIYADYFHQVWPNAKLILVVRDPRDQAISLRKYTEDYLVKKSQRPNFDFEVAASQWKHTISQARKVLAREGIPYSLVQYESLVTNPERELANLSEFLRIDLSSSLDFYEKDFVSVHTSRHAHLKGLNQPINKNSVGKWRKILSKEEIAVFSRTAGDLMSELGYLDK